MRESILPPEFQELRGKVQYVQQVGRNEYSSSCPRCSGSMHEDGTYPDRFRMFIKSKATGGPLSWCRSCGFIWFPGKGAKLTTEQIKVFEEERRTLEERRLDEIRSGIDCLNREQKWLQYHEQLCEEARDYLALRHIDGYWLEHWQLGFCPDKQIWTKAGDDWLENYSRTITIPIFEAGSGKVLNLKHRLLDDVPGAGKYRAENKGLPASLFVADHERKLTGPALIVEGEFKSMTTYITVDDPRLHVIGVPSKTPELELLNQLADCEPLYVCLDPDAYTLDADQIRRGMRVTAIQRLVTAIGSRARVLELPYKIDDMICQGWLGQAGIKSLMNTAARAAVTVKR